MTARLHRVLRTARMRIRTPITGTRFTTMRAVPLHRRRRAIQTIRSCRATVMNTRTVAMTPELERRVISS
jgi:hypothetical protein